MTDDLHDLNNRLKKSAEDFSLTPSPGVWENVEREINRKDRKRRAFIWLWIGIAALIGSGGWLVRSGFNKAETVSEQQIVVDDANSVVQKTGQSNKTDVTDHAKTVYPDSPSGKNAGDPLVVQATVPPLRTNGPTKYSRKPWIGSQPLITGEKRDQAQTEVRTNTDVKNDAFNAPADRMNDVVDLAFTEPLNVVPIDSAQLITSN
ncbi:MAG TPA: hypothetical protein VK826_14910, partial [Bacteroidia bacterium]|nr:hypothetical protein [Bacteroidia bacterium]